MTGSSALTWRRTSLCTGSVSAKSAPAALNVLVNRPAISAETAATWPVGVGRPEIGYRENDAGSDDADANLADPIDSEYEGVPVRAAGLTEFVVRDDRGRITGQRRRVRGKILQDCGAEGANGSPQRQPHKKRAAVLRKARAQHNDRNGTDDRADHAKPAFAQRRAELRLTHDRG